MKTITRGAAAVIITLFLAVCAAAAVGETPATPAPAGADVRNNPAVVLYSVAWCPHCRAAKEYFKKNHIAYTNRDVEEDGDAMTALVEKYKSKSVPVIVLGNDEKILMGFNEAEFEKAYEEVRKGK